MFMFQFSPVHSYLVLYANSTNSFLASLCKACIFVLNTAQRFFAFESFRIRT